MKKIIVSLACLLSVSFLSASDKFIEDQMKQMRDGMVQIQDGFFYGKKEDINKGIALVEKSFAVEKKKLLPKEKAHMVGMATNTSTKIENSLKQMKKALDKNQMTNASMQYSQIVNSCTNCHKVVRGW